MALNKKRKPTPEPSDGDMITNRDVHRFGYIAYKYMSGRNSTFRAVMTKSLIDEISTKLELIGIESSDVFQAIFKSISVTKLNEFRSNKYYYFDLHKYDKECTNVGTMCIRLFFGESGKKPHRRVEKIVLGEDVRYAAPGA
jgi:hypothetical protein